MWEISCWNKDENSDKLVDVDKKEGREVLERAYPGADLREPGQNMVALAPDSEYTYELAPKEPAACWRNEYRDSDGTTRFGDAVYGSEYDAKYMVGSNCIRTVKFVEAIE